MTTQVKATIHGRTSGDAIVWAVSLTTRTGREVYSDVKSDKATAECAARAIARERGYAIVKEWMADDEPPPDEGPNYRDFPGEDRCYDMQAQDEMYREDAMRMS